MRRQNLPSLPNALTAFTTALALALGAACGSNDRDPPGGNPPAGKGTPSIVRFDVTPSEVPAGMQATLTWEVTDAERLEIVATPGGPVLDTMDRFSDTTMSLPITAPTTFELTATNSKGTKKESRSVTVAAARLGITRFEATPNPAPLMGQTTLIWATTAATRVKLLRDAEVLVDTTTTAAAGSHAVVLEETETIFTLEASDGAATERAMVTVRAEKPPQITFFRITPRGFSDPSAQLQVTWTTLDATQVALTGNDMPVAEFPGTATGTITVTASATTRYVLTARSGGGEVRASISVARTTGEAEPNNDTATANRLSMGGGQGAIDMAGDVDVYRFTVDSAGSSVFIETFNPAGGPCAVDTVAVLLGTDGMELGRNDDTVGLCSAIDPMRDAFASDLAAGDYFVQIQAIGAGTGAYGFSVLVSPPACGNNLTETRASEECDDGNTTAGDGCNATCRYEIAGMLSGGPGNEMTFRGAIANPGELDVYVVEMTQMGYIEAETYVPDAPSCTEGAGDTVLILRGAMGDITGDDDIAADNVCSRIDPREDPAAAVGPGTYHIVVRAYSRMAVIGSYAVRIKTFAPGCGNSILEANETCDDGNTTPGDGCNATCQFEGAAETEPNETSMQATAIGNNPIITGSIPMDTDVDVFSVMVPMGHHLEAYLTVTTLNDCDDAFGALQLRAPDGMTVLDDDFLGGVGGMCGRIAPDTSPAARAMAGGTYYLRVTEALGGTIGRYYLHVRTIAPACGNGITDVNEQCDDANTAAGDGCTAQCTYEIAGMVSGMGGRVMVNLPSGDSFGVVKVTLATPGQAITATTSNGQGGCDTPVAIALQHMSTILGGHAIGGDCNGLLYPADRFATNLASGDYFIRVGNTSGMAGSTVLDVGILNPSCGNGVLETRANEQCDDENMANGDGCSSTCRFEGSIVMETEPNEDRARANAVNVMRGSTVTVTGSVNPAGDLDFFSFMVPQGGTVVAQTYGQIGDLASCNGDTHIFLINSAGMELADHDDGDDTVCSHLDGTMDMAAANLPAGQYFIRVQHFRPTGVVVPYFMNINVR